MKKVFSGLVLLLGIGLMCMTSCHSKKDVVSQIPVAPVNNTPAAPDTMIGAIIATPITMEISQAVNNNMQQQQQELVNGWEVLEYEADQNDTIVTVDLIPDSNSLQAIKLGLNDEVLFKINSAQLSPKADTILTRVAENLNNFPMTDATVIGFTSHTGPQQFNVKLSKERAEAVMNYLIKKGVAKDRLKAMGKGWNDPVASNANAAGRAKNRRVEIWVTANQNMIQKAAQ